MEILTRKAAHERNLKFFFSGRPCRKGHLSRRYVSTGSCVDCQKEHVSPFRKGNTVSLTVEIHGDDTAKLYAYVNALRIARGLMPSGSTALKPAPRFATDEEVRQARAQIMANLTGPTAADVASGPSEWSGGLLK